MVGEMGLEFVEEAARGEDGGEDVIRRVEGEEMMGTDVIVR